MDSKEINDIISKLQRINKIYNEIFKNYPKEKIEAPVNLKYTEEKEKFIKDFKNVEESLCVSYNKNSSVMISFRKWKQMIAPLGLRDATDSELKEMSTLRNLKVPKSEICRKFNISYPTLKKFLEIADYLSSVEKDMEKTEDV